MNTRLHLTVLAIVFAFLTPTTSILHAQVLAATDGIDVPDGTRKCIKPNRACTETDRFAVHAADLSRGGCQRQRHDRQPG